ncbi:MAG: ThuA domain-containing protein [Bacteroidetes bacterium]|nr:ThuA domain-containing protein [Bacteroidota bacterium]
MTLSIFLVLILLAFTVGGLFLYKITYGFNFYETEPPELPANLGDQSVLLFSKTNAFRHGEAIEASIPAFQEMAEDNGWSIFVTDNGAVFNPEQLASFDVVIWNNTSGKVLNSEQREHFRNYLENGGGFVGIHAAGDNSHQWDWYETEVIGARFSHHPLNPQFQEGQLTLEPDSIHQNLYEGLPETWTRTDEWYIFYNNPREDGFNILYRLDGSQIEPDGNIPILASDKNWGMGEDHSIAWYNSVGEGRVFYSAMGHQASAFEEAEHLRMLENAIRWAGRFDR